MRGIREAFAHALLGLLGVVFGLLSAVALVVAAFIPALLGLLAFVLSPLRVLYERIRGSG